MGDEPADTLGCKDLQEFTDTGVQDPAVLAALAQRYRRPLRWSPWVYWLIGGCLLVAALLAGLLLGHFLG